ncbi:tetrapyrrole methylase [Catenaria anguillulae PL171]|uniref:diphthine methyl ester synthase n=1 Tax=Catenaria anguillulae PL171 TaxID=765915 RepID=A0A1Y2HG59_9FUNG|nr:tetrapyrrole methylase [Catenaria anguillulae PL171]
MYCGVDRSMRNHLATSLATNQPTQAPTMLYVIGLGLGDERDITLRGLDAIKSCTRIHLEAYTSILPGIDIDRLEALYGQKIQLAHRETVESESDSILLNADKENVAFLVVGDPFGATTHTDLILRAKEQGIPVEVIHNASIMNAIGCCGMVFFHENWRPDSWYDKILKNRELGLHTLCLLDIKVREQSWENMARGRLVYEPPRYMTVNQAVEQMLEIEEKRKEAAYTPTTIAIGVARVGTKHQIIKAGTMEELLTADFGEPLHSLIIPAKMHELERDYVRMFAINRETFDKYAEVE